MSWVGVGVAAVGAVAGSRAANQNRKQARAHDAFRKQAITYSPWTGMGDPGAANVGNTDSFTGMLGGAAQGYAVGSGIGGAFGKMGGAAAGAGGMGAAGQNALGSNQMVGELGQMGQNMGQMQASLGSAGPGTWSQMAGSAGALGSANQMQMPQLGSGMMGMNNQMQGMQPYSQKNLLGMNY